MLFSVPDFIFDCLTTVKLQEGYQMEALELFQNIDGLILEAGAESCCQPFCGTNPLARVDGITDPTYVAVRGVEIGKATEYHMMKKIGTFTCTRASVIHKCTSELTVYPAARIIRDLLDLKLIFWHRFSSLKNTIYDNMG